MISSSGKRIANSFIENNKKFSEIERCSKKDLEYLLNYTIDLLSVPHPCEDLRRYFYEPEIVSLFLIELFNNGLRTSEERHSLSSEFQELYRKIKPPKRNYQIRLRILDKEGSYPNLDLKRGDTEYTTINFLPILITTSKVGSEEKFSNSSEVKWINRKELKVATCCMLAPLSGICGFYFPDYNQVELNIETIKNVPENLRKHFLLEILNYQNRFKPLIQNYRERESTPDVSTFNFFSFEDSVDAYNKIFDSYSIRDHLLMRTSNYLLKSYMLWKNRNFGEDSIANVMFCLEGCLHLLFRKYSKTNNKFNLKELEDIFIDLYTKGRGEELFSFIQEGYYKRISIVHAQPNWGAEWTPLLFADDYFDYFNICRELLNIVLIDRKIDY
jgi:hypothetical protein